MVAGIFQNNSNMSDTEVATKIQSANIKADELMIGNIVMYEDVIDVVYSINKWKEQIGLETLPFPSLLSVAKGIPLTIPILQSFRFAIKMNDGKGMYEVKNFSLVSNWTLDGELYFSLGGYDKFLRVQYFHQLQNLYFLLTGEELISNWDGMEVKWK